VGRAEYQLLDIEDGFVSLLTESGDTRDDLKLPDYPEGFDQVRVCVCLVRGVVDYPAWAGRF